MSPTRWVAAGLVVALALVIAVTFGAVPTGNDLQRFGESEPAEEDAIQLRVKIDSVDATKALIRMRIDARPGPAFPADGVLVFTDIPGLPLIRVLPDGLSSVNSVELDVVAGDVSDYPFDRYQAGFTASAVAGAHRTLDDAVNARLVPFGVIGSANTPGFAVEGEAETADRTTGFIGFEAERDASTRTWAVAMMAMMAMMAINWMLAAASVAVVVSVVIGQRVWETRHLAWLGSMLFAMSAFRNTAPGNPPIGTFLDFYASFPAIALVVASLLTLVAVYLLRDRERLGL